MSRETQRKGDIGLTHAIAFFTKEELDVSIPVTESAPYDLIVDCLDGLKRVQVRYTTGKQVGLRRIHSNSKGYVVKKTKENVYDWLFVVWNKDGVFEEHLIKECLSNRTTINLSESTKYGRLAESGLLR